MRSISVVLSILFSLAAAPLASAADDFSSEVDLRPLETLTVQHQQTLKTLDSWARQTITTITGKSKLKGAPPLYTALDMTFRPEPYRTMNIVKVRHVPLRMDFRQIDFLSDAEKDRILKEGTISLELWQDPRVEKAMIELSSTAVHKASAIQQLDGAANTLANLVMTGLPPAALVPPATNARDDHKWRHFAELAGTIPSWVQRGKERGATPPAVVQGYENKTPMLEKAAAALLGLREAWIAQDATAANQQIAALAQTLPAITPERYPSDAKRNVEVVYNRLAKLTLPGAFLYFIAFVLFLLSARAGVERLRLWGLRIFIVALFVHTAGIGIRWWLVAETHGNWFDGIPIKNQFESVLMSAWFGAVFGLILEMRRSRGIFGAAASFVGWLSLIAIFSAPLVFGRDIGGEIGQVNGVLMSYWLYIHVTMVVAAYALIAMGFLLACWWLVSYYRSYGTLKRIPKRMLSSDAAPDDDVIAMSGGGGAISMGFAATLARMLFMPIRAAEAPAATTGKSSRAKAETTDELRQRTFLATLDQCHLVVV